MTATITWYYKDGRKITKREVDGTDKELKKIAKDTMAIYKNAGATSYEIRDESGKAIA